MKLGWILWLASVLGGNVQEQTCLATTVYLEARDQPVEGQYAVAEVALRRRESGRWGNNVCGVVKSSGQFAPTLLSKNYAVDNAKAWQKAWKVAGNSLQMWRLPAAYRKEYVPGADHFFAHEIARPAWLAYAEPIKVIGGHSFYRVDGVFRPAAMESLPHKVDGQATPATATGSAAGAKSATALTVRGAG
jgi:spore germination cell wall hydrolase CwlJ-like protein